MDLVEKKLYFGYGSGREEILFVLWIWQRRKSYFGYGSGREENIFVLRIWLRRNFICVMDLIEKKFYANVPIF